MQEINRLTLALDIAEEEFGKLCDRIVASMNPELIRMEQESKKNYHCHKCGGGYGKLCANPPVPCAPRPWFNEDSLPGQFFKFVREWDGKVFN